MISALIFMAVVANGDLAGGACYLAVVSIAVEEWGFAGMFAVVAAVAGLSIAALILGRGL